MVAGSDSHCPRSALLRTTPPSTCPLAERSVAHARYGGGASVRAHASTAYPLQVSPPPRASNPRLSAGAFEVYSTFGTGGPISRWNGDGEPAQPLILTQSGGSGHRVTGGADLLIRAIQRAKSAKSAHEAGGEGGFRRAREVHPSTVSFSI